MAFEMKVLDKIRCPRCNAKAELRIDQKEPKGNWVFVFIVCHTCKLNKYSHSTTRKAVYFQSRINRLKKNAPESRMLTDKLKKLEELKRGAERSF
jgi:hypothetical protein